MLLACAGFAMAADDRNPMTTTSTHAEIRTAAQQWFARLLAPDCNDLERAAFNRWRAASPLHDAAYREVADVWERSAGLREDPVIAAALQEAMRPAAPLGRPRHQRWWPALAAAASVVLAVAASLWVFMPRDAAAIRYATALGEQRTVVLADGSRVVLDTGSELLAQIDEHMRKLTLQHGQADFEVRHDTARPFIVHVGDGSVTATGTHFQIRVGESDSIVTLLQGQVVVAANARDSSRPATLQPGERIAIEPAGRLGALQAVSESELASARGWTSGNLVVKAWRLDAVVAEMNRYSSTKLRLGDPALGSVPISGVFKAGDQKSFALALEYGWSIDAGQRPPAGDIVLTRK
jgi:transmembrane sensor